MNRDTAHIPSATQMKRNTKMLIFYLTKYVTVLVVIQYCLVVTLQITPITILDLIYHTICRKLTSQVWQYLKVNVMYKKNLWILVTLYISMVHITILRFHQNVKIKWECGRRNAVHYLCYLQFALMCASI